MYRLVHSLRAQLIVACRGPKCDVGSASHALDMITDQCGLYGVSRILERWHDSSDLTFIQAGSYSDKSDQDRTYSYGYTNWRQHDYCNVPAGTRM